MESHDVDRIIEVLKGMKESLYDISYNIPDKPDCGLDCEDKKIFRDLVDEVKDIRRSLDDLDNMYLHLESIKDALWALVDKLEKK